MEPKIRELMDFLDGAHSVYHAVAGLAWELEANGYQCLSESDTWNLQAGGKYYLTRGGSAVIAFRIPVQEPAGFMMSASHADRPCFKLKESAELSGKYTRLAVEGYGGMIRHSWLDRPLSLAGRVLVQTEEGIESRLVDVDRDLLLIPSVAIHMDRQVNEGKAWNPAVDMLPLMGSAESGRKLDELLTEVAGGEILGHDLYLYNRQKATLWGMEEEFLSAPALDDLECAWCCCKGFLEAEESAAVPVLCVFDSEEVGSASLQGAASCLLESVLNRICKACELDMDRMLSQSFMVSADNAHAIHPNHPEYADTANAPVIGGGPVIKFNANMRYTTDGATAAVWRKVCRMANVPVQTYCNRADMPGGSTLGNISLGHVSVPTVDLGLPQLAMHASYETAGVQDALYFVDAMTAFYSCAMEIPADGTYVIR